MKYKVIKSRSQYMHYCDRLEDLVSSSDSHYDDEIELLTLLIEKWDEENLSLKKSDPVEIIEYMMKEKHLNQSQLASIMGVNKSTASKIMNYKKGLSKNVIRRLSEYFGIRQEVLNRPYPLKQDQVV